MQINHDIRAVKSLFVSFVSRKSNSTYLWLPTHHEINILFVSMITAFSCSCGFIVSYLCRSWILFCYQNKNKCSHTNQKLWVIEDDQLKQILWLYLPVCQSSKSGWQVTYWQAIAGAPQKSVKAPACHNQHPENSIHTKGNISHIT